MEDGVLLATVDILTFRAGLFLLGTEAASVAWLVKLFFGMGDRPPLADLRQLFRLEPSVEE